MAEKSSKTVAATLGKKDNLFTLKYSHFYKLNLKTSMIRYGFIGGTQRGLKLMEKLISEKYLPEFSVILKEDDHEEIKCYDEISDLMKSVSINYSVKKKLIKEDYDLIKKSKLDFLLVYGWRTLIDTTVNEHLKFGSVAVHHSLLPLYRGFAPMQWAIINGEKETGVTLFLINEGEVDSGKIIIQKRIPILPEDYALDVYEKSTECTIDVCLEFFENYRNDKIKLTDQDESKATYCCKRTPEDGKIDWTKDSTEIFNLIRALAYPFTGAFCNFGDSCFHIRKAVQGESNNKKFTGIIPGRVIKISKEGIEVMCGKGTILLSEWENKSTGIVNNPSEIIKSLSSTLS